MCINNLGVSFLSLFSKNLQFPQTSQAQFQMSTETQSNPKRPLTAVVVGAGQRGTNYAEFSEYFPAWLKITGVAEPVQKRREKFAKKFELEEKNVYSDWKDLAAQPRIADAVFICTLDSLHTEPAVAFANKGYHILLEKPMAIKLSECRLIKDAVLKNKVVFAVGHVLRYSPFNRELKKIIDSGVLGKIINIQHIEPVGYWHFAHSFVRGNWGNEAKSTFSLMSKSCHDIDLVHHFMGQRFARVSSFGRLTYFNKANKPAEAGSATNCLTCPITSTCPYSAQKIYLESYRTGTRGWPLTVVTDTVDIESLTEALTKGPYGRCVYECDNDVADQVIVNVEFEQGATASITMVATSDAICERKTRIYGSTGDIEADAELGKIVVNDFVNGKRENIRPTGNSAAGSGHGGGDFGLVRSFLEAVAAANEGKEWENTILPSVQETFDSHAYVFAAEHSRKTGTVVDVAKYLENEEKNSI